MKTFLHRRPEIGGEQHQQLPGAVCQTASVSGKPRAFSAISSGAAAIGALAIGALSIGALALGALAIGRLVIGRLSIRKAKIRTLEVGELKVGRLEVADQVGSGEVAKEGEATL